MVIVFGVCAILLSVFAGLGVLLAIVLRGTDSDEGKKIVMLALRELVTGTLIEVAQLPGRLARALVDIFWQGPPSGGNQMSPPAQPGPGQQGLPPAIGGEPTPPAEPRI
ncbi:hypothetical protein [Nocardia sp. NRRL S-836]|uniref:hypothetical protein n=1 Tax=Nocardia sp. NRRL S-836 TaxID=1519492 RepID=UPI0012F8940E|nr:hypothetical protein [Nocardia sp. NRRL S-836]